MARGNKSVGQLYIERIERQMAEQRETGKVVDFTMLPEERAVIEKQIGRELTSREVIQGHLDRGDNRTFAQALEDNKWRPVMPKQDDDPYAAAVREAEEAVRQEQYSKLSAAEKRLFHAKELQLKKLQEAATKAEHDARLADPKVAQALAKLRELERRAAFDPDWQLPETNAIKRAIIQLETPGALLDEGFKLADAAFGIEKAKLQRIADAKRKAIAELQLQIDDLGLADEATATEPTANDSQKPGETQQAKDTHPKPAAKPNPVIEWSRKFSELLKTQEEASKAIDDLKAKKVKGAELQSAYDRFNAAFEARAAHVEGRPQEAAPAAK